MKIGFTGTRIGMSSKQKTSLKSLLKQLSTAKELHIGCCYGADSEIFEYCFGILYIISHPSNIISMTNPRIIRNSDKIYPTSHPLSRNKRISSYWTTRQRIYP